MTLNQVQALERLRGDYRMETSGKSAEVFLYGGIGGWYGVTAAAFVKALNELDVDEIQLRVNSPGGVVTEGVAMMNALRRHKARVVATVDGLAASAASFLILAADEIVMGRGAQLMIHDAWVITWGSAAEIRKDADYLDKLSGTIASLYAERAGGTAQEWRALMLEETWYSDSEAVEAGLADRVEPLRSTSTSDSQTVLGDDVDGEDDDAILDIARVAGFKYAGRQNAPAPGMPHHLDAAAGPRPTKTSAFDALAALAGVVTEPPAPPAGEPTPSGEEVAMGDLNKRLGERLGLPAGAEPPSDEVILAAVDEALEERAEPAAEAPAVPEGTTLVDTATLAQLQADAEAGRQARDEQIAERRARIITTALQEGRISRASAQTWRERLDADEEGTQRLLATLRKDTVPVTEVGFTGGPDEARDEDSETYARVYGAEKKEA